ncbi:hypothetical protein [Eggerthella sp. YY7918]|uniref:hypothetical protein n=1 Tax=Eggerthella sp. (strain YY7918) TaxID=502558 RepID=UPI00021713D4|nr:hypothetical protein [Eggerthella sp. YY7918]BAK44280.1 hypothetical protein EGYY_11040 [Eggerthella sp. YY7918]
MSGSQKALKVISIILIVWALLGLLLGIFFAGGSLLPGISEKAVDVGGGSINMAAAAMIIGVLAIFCSLVYLVVAILGLRGAKNPQKIGVFFVMCIIGLVLAILAIALDIMNGVFDWTNLLDLVIIIVCTILAQNIRKQVAQA